MATIKDVAREANVSVGTVSAVFNGKETIKSENVIKVRDAAQKLGYKPRYAWRMLSENRTKNIGLIIPNISNPFYSEFTRGAEDAAYKKGMTLFQCNSDSNADKELTYVDALMSKGAEGIIIVKSQLSLKKLIEISADCNIVLVDSNVSARDRFDTIESNDRFGTEAAMKHLFEFGHTKIAYIGGTIDTQSGRTRLKVYKEMLESREIEVDESLIRTTTYNWYGGYSAIMDILRQGNIPTAVMCANDLIAMGVIRALKEKSLIVPRDMSVIGYDDIDQAAYYSPALTTIHLLKYEMGSTSVDVLLQRINGENTNSSRRVCINFDTQLVTRETVNYARSMIEKCMHIN